mgnify:CR=1 FL=1
MSTMRDRAIAAVAALLFCFAGINAATAEPGPPRGLMCDLLRNPAEALIRDRTPELSWQVDDPARGAAQSAYHIVVASTREKAASGEGDMWDTGKVQSDRSLNIEYDGGKLEAGTSYWWTVRTWDADGNAGPFSEPQQFRVSPVTEEREWPAQARWVDVETDEGTRWMLEERQAMRFVPVRPRTFKTRGETNYFYDFGRAAYAKLRLTVTCEESETGELEVHVGEKKAGPKKVDRSPGGTIRHNAFSIDLKPGTHTYTLEINPHGNIRLPDHLAGVTPFRYAELVDCPVPRQDVEAVQMALFYPFNDNASLFQSGDPTLNDVWSLCKYSMKATNAFGIYIDGDRERKPYEADAYINQLGYYCCDREYAISRYSHEYLLFHPTWPTEWSLHSVLMAHDDWMWTGNLESAERFYETLKAKTLWMLAREDGLIETGHVTDDQVLKAIHRGGKLRDIVDWPRSERKNYDFKPVNTVVNAFYYRSLRDLADIARALGKKEEAKELSSRAEKLHDTFNRKLYDADRELYVDGLGTDHCSFHANMFALALGLVPEGRQARVVEFLKDGGMACSVYGVQYLLEAMYDTGNAAHALELMTDEDTDRSWPHMIYDMGTTITAEAWDRKYKGNLDWNHAWGAAPANIIPRKLAGIQPLEAGFRTVRIRPRPGGLERFSMCMPTMRGTVSVEYYSRGDQHMQLRVTVPANTGAEVHVPGVKRQDVRIGDKKPGDVPHVEFLRHEDGAAVYRVGAGSYKFTR